MDTNESGIEITSIAPSHNEHTLFVTDAKQNRLLILDVSKPEKYNLIGTLLFERGEYGLQDVITSATGNYLYISGDTFDIINIENPSSPHQVSSLEISSEIWGSMVYRLELLPDSETVSITFQDEGMAMVYVDVMNPSLPSFILDDEHDYIKRTYQPYLNRVIKNVTLGFSVSYWKNEIDVWDLVNPDSWGYYHKITTFETLGDKRNIAISSDEEYLYLSSGTDGIQIIGFHGISQ